MRTKTRTIEADGFPVLTVNELPLEDGAPKKVRLFAYGRTTYTEAPGRKPEHYDFTEEDADALIAEFERRGVDVVIDYNHQQLRSKSNGQPAPAAGWITALEKRPDGLHGDVRWTKKAEEHLVNREFRYTSPVFLVGRRSRRVLCFHNLALTNQPATDKQAALVAAQFDFENDNEPPINQGDQAMNEELTKLLGLEASGDESGDMDKRVLEAVTQLKKTGESLDAFVESMAKPLGLEGEADIEMIKGAVLRMTEKSAESDELADRVKALESELTGRKRDDMIERGLKDGKLTKHMVDEWAKDLDLATLENFLKTTPKQRHVPTELLDRSKLAEDDAVALTAEQSGILSQLGITAEEDQKNAMKVA